MGSCKSSCRTCWLTRVVLTRTEKATRDRLLPFAQHCETRGVCQRDAQRGHTVLGAIQHHQERFRTNNNILRSNSGSRRWDKVGSRFGSQLCFLKGLLQQSEANNAQIQNEITLVSLAYSKRYAVDSRAYRNRLSMWQHGETARFSYR
jgi:hypothetical protein